MLAGVSGGLARYFDIHPAKEGEDDEPDAEDGGVDVEVAGQPAADAGEHAIGAAALEQPCFRDVCSRFAHGFRMAARHARDHPE